MSQTLIVKERLSNDELQEARKELINTDYSLIIFLELKEMGSRAVIRVKRMGELDPTPFQDACKKKYSSDAADVNASLLCTYWQDELRDSNWFPFVNVKVGENKYKILSLTLSETFLHHVAY
ncbi:hypothetical protein MKX01_005224 [Papaver californicum]|nr:hypothetical protein MKX01_005224 [Papaver californicum]